LYLKRDSLLKKVVEIIAVNHGLGPNYGTPILFLVFEIARQKAVFLKKRGLPM
jgi:hypothetical protein